MSYNNPNSQMPYRPANYPSMSNEQYDQSSSYKYMPQTANYHQQQQSFPGNMSSGLYPQSQTSIALFHIPSDATNSLYVDGVPNDTTEREVSRNSSCI